MSENEHPLDTHAADGAVPIDDADLTRVVGGLGAAGQSLGLDPTASAMTHPVDKSSPKLFGTCVNPPPPPT